MGWWWLLSGLAHANATITIITPPRLAEITEVSPSYDPIARTLLVTGVVSGLGNTLPPGYAIDVNGVPAVTFPLGASIAYTATLPFDTTGPTMFRDAYAVVQPLLARIVDTQHRQIHGYAKTSVYDNRLGYVDVDYQGGLTSDGAWAQISDRGLGRLVPTWSSVLPYPDLASTQADLHAAADALGEAGFFPAVEVCEPLGDAGLDVWLLADWLAVLGEAEVEYEAFRVIVDAAQAVPTPANLAAAAAARLASCVQHPPEVDDFELCVGVVRTDPTDLTVSGVDANRLDVDGSWPGIVQGGFSLASPIASLDASLRGLSIRHTGGPFTCVLHPEQGISDATAASDPQLSAWSACADVEVSGAVAESTFPAGYDVMIDVDPMLQRTDATVAGEFDVVAPVAAAAVGTCGEAWVSPAVEAALLDRVPDLEDAIAEAWISGAPASRTAEALDLVLTPFELEPVPVCDVDLTVTTSLAEPAEQESLRFRYATDAHPSAGLDAALEPRVWMYASPGQVGFRHDGLDPWGAPFDLAYNLTTGFLNQIARARGTHLLLGRALEPTWTQLGVGVPAGADPDAPAVLDGRTLGRLYPGFSVARRNTFSIQMQPVAVPFTFMPNDTAYGGPGEAPLSYQLADLRVVLKLHTPQGTFDAVELALDMYESGLVLDFDGGGSPFLHVDWSGGPPITTSLVRSIVPSCPVSSSAQRPGAPGCEAALTTALSRVIVPMVGDLLLEAISQVPAPQRFDGAGWGNPGVVAPRAARIFYDRQNITMYADLPTAASPVVPDDAVCAP